MPFYDKGRVTGIMVSEYLTPGGNLQLPPDNPEDDHRLESNGDPYRECTASPVFRDGFLRHVENDRDISRIVETLAILGEISRKTANHECTIFYHFKDDVYSVAITASQRMVFSARISA
jgi:hypothetical protein